VPSRRATNARSSACALSSTSAHSALSVRRVRGSARGSCHGRYGHRVRTGLIEGRPAAFLSAGPFLFKDHLDSVWLILCSVVPCSSPCSVCGIIDLLFCDLFASVPICMAVLIGLPALSGATSSAVPCWGIIVRDDYCPLVLRVDSNENHVKRMC
jgi:hypothetical protein